MTKHHSCGKPEWAHCCICDGRIHLPGCTTRKIPRRDCCPLRHQILHIAGQKRGISDTSQAMWSVENPQGYHDPSGSDEGFITATAANAVIGLLQNFERHGVTEDRMEYSIDDLMTSNIIDEPTARILQRALHEGSPYYKPF